MYVCICIYTYIYVYIYIERDISSENVRNNY